MTEYQNDISTDLNLDSGADSGVLEIRLSSLVRNYQIMAKKSGKAATAAVVKADAYGLGLENIVPQLIAAGCASFFVANLNEAINCRRFAPAADIYVFSGFVGQQADLFLSENIIPCLNSLRQIKMWQAACAQLGKPLPAAINIDTGFNRLGLDEGETMSLSEDTELFSGWSLKLIMSHLACGDNPEHPMNNAQRERFLNAAALLPEAPKSLANSAGIFLGETFHFDLTRCGISLYGGAAQGSETALETVISVYGHILQIKNISIGETVGYGATYVAQSEQTIAIVSVGYADGFLRASGHAHAPFALAHVKNMPAPIIGRVSMDLLAIDITNIDTSLETGDRVELLGANSLVDKVASQAGTISYELLTGLGNRYKRICL